MSKLTPDERKKKVRELRASGMTFRKIGEEMGVSTNRARQIHEMQTWTERRERLWPELKTINGVLASRIANALSRNGISTIDELKAISPERIRNMRNIGKESFEIIMRIRGEVKK